MGGKGEECGTGKGGEGVMAWAFLIRTNDGTESQIRFSTLAPTGALPSLSHLGL